MSVNAANRPQGYGLVFSALALAGVVCCSLVLGSNLAAFAAVNLTLICGLFAAAIRASPQMWSTLFSRPRGSRWVS